MEYIILLLNNVFAFFDRIIAWGIANVYDLIITISTISIFDAETIQKFTARINILLGLFMLFWLSMRIIKYVINPDLTSDKQQGFGKIIINVVITLTMLALVNYGFSWAYKIQGDILSSNFLPKVVFGLDNNNYDPTKSTQGKNLAYLLYSAFVYPDPGMLASCENFYGITNDKVKLTACYDEIKGISKSAYTKWSRGVTKTDAELILSSAVVSARSGSSYIFSYTPIISTICGAVMFIVLVQFAVDVSVRAVKLGFLQLIAPIPIISYLDPNSGKNGMFSKWLKMVGSTFASLFIRLLALFFGIFVIMLVTTSDLTDNVTNQVISKTEHPFLVVMIIIGVLIFVKEFPKLISEITGIKNEGFGLGVSKALLAGGAGAAGGFIAGAYSGAHNNGVMGAIKHGFGGMAGAGGRAFAGSLKTGKVGEAAGQAIQRSNQARNANLAYSKAHYTFGDRVSDSFNEWAGNINAHGHSNKMQDNVKDITRQIENNTSQESALRMSAANIMGQSGMSGEQLMSSYQSYSSERAKFEKKVGDQFGRDSETYASGMKRFEESYKAAHPDIDYARQYVNVQNEITRLDDETNKLRSDLKIDKNALDARTDLKKKSGK